MRHFGTVMLLASAAMLLFPVWWEGRGHDASALHAEAGAAPEQLPGQSTLRAEDLLPAWRGPSSGEGG